MFARTQRLLLRPGFPEDALIVAAFGNEAADVLGYARDPLLPAMLILERTEAAPRVIGTCRLRRCASGQVEIGCWIARNRRRRGFATEACAALIEIGRALGLPSIEASHFDGDSASARLLDKLGFGATGLTVSRRRGDGARAPARIMRLGLVATISSDERALAA